MWCDEDHHGGKNLGDRVYHHSRKTYETHGTVSYRSVGCYVVTRLYHQLLDRNIWEQGGVYLNLMSRIYILALAIYFWVVFVDSTNCVGFNVLVEMNDGFVIGHRRISSNVVLGFDNLYSLVMLWSR